MSTTLTSPDKRCPWCQLPLPRSVARASRGHRCPAKPRTYLTEAPRPVPAALTRRRRSPR